MRSVQRRRAARRRPTACRQRMRADPLFRDVTSDAQLKGLQARLNIDRDKANLLGVQIADIRSALYSAFGERQVSTIYTSSDSYQVIMQAAAEDRSDESAFGKIYVRSKNGALVPLSSIRDASSATSARSSINHAGQLQALTVSFNLAPGAALGDATSEDRAVQARTQHAGERHHQLRRRRRGVPVSQAQPDRADRRGAAGDLRAARRAVRKLHPPDHDPRRPALGGGRRAGDAVAVQHGPVDHRHDRHPDADRHRQEERHHDDRLRARRAAQRRHGAARGDPRGLPAALPADHDDDARRR